MTVHAPSHPALFAPSPSAPAPFVPSLADLLHDDSGQDMIEYALIATFIGLGTVTGIHGLAASIANYLNIVDGGFNNSLSGHA